MVTCPVCGEVYEKEAFLSLYTSPFNGVTYKLYHCRSCDLQWWEPLRMVREFYEEEGNEAYLAFHMGKDRNLGENHMLFIKSRLKKEGVLLDVGCGDCLFLEKLRSMYGIEVYGIDIDRRSIEVCRKKRAIENAFVCEPSEFVAYCREKGIAFDIITFFEVLEHQDRPLEFLRAIVQMLKPGGYIAGTVPNRDSWLVYSDGRVKKDWDMPPHHLLRFSPTSLKFLLQKAGFQIVRVSLSSFGLSKWLGFAFHRLRGLIPDGIKPEGKYIYFEAHLPLLTFCSRL